MGTGSRGWSVIALFTTVLVVWAALCNAADLRVPDDYRTIEEAVRAARSGDTIIVEDRSLRDSITIRNARRITITNDSHRDVVLRGRRDTEPVIELINCSDITIIGFTIQSGSMGIYAERCRDITLEECTVKWNAGPGLYVDEYTAQTTTKIFILEDTTIMENATWGIEVIGDPESLAKAQIEMIDSEITGNRSGGLMIRDARATIESTDFTANRGYGIVVDGSTEVEFVDSGSPTVISDNHSGGVLVRDATFTLQGTTRIENNIGVGIEAERANLAVIGATITGHGTAAIIYRESQGSVSHSTISDNPGLGIVIEQGSDVNISSTDVARQGGDGIRVLSSATVTISNGSSLRSNGGVGLLADATTVTMTGSSATDNNGAGVRLINAVSYTHLTLPTN